MNVSENSLQQNGMEGGALPAALLMQRAGRRGGESKYHSSSGYSCGVCWHVFINRDSQGKRMIPGIYYPCKQRISKGGRDFPYELVVYIRFGVKIRIKFPVIECKFKG